MPVVINGTTGIETPGVDADPGSVLAQTLTVNSNNISAVNSLGFRNRIINGDMRINQRGITSVVGGSETYTLDRWVIGNYFLSGAISVAQSTDAPAGFSNSLLVTNGTGEALVASDYGVIRQKIEGSNIADFAWGTSSAAPITISFWVKSSVTGSYSVGLLNGALNRSNRTTFTINAANTWEQKSVLFVGDTTGTWTTNNGIGLYVDFLLVAGSNQYASPNTWTANTLEGVSGASATWVTSTNATFFITGVQLEAGTVATPFERRDIGRELIMCQRYYQNIGGQTLTGFAETSTSLAVTVFFYQQMRASPTCSIRSGTLSVRSPGGDYSAASPVLANTTVGTNAIWTNISGFTGLTGNAVVTSRLINADVIAANAEL